MSGPEPDYTAARAVVGYTIAALRSLPISFAWTTTQMIVDMLSNYDWASSNPEEVSRRWDYNGGYGASDAGQYIRFIVDVDPNETVSYTIDYDIYYLACGAMGWYQRHVHIGPIKYWATAPGPENNFGGKSWNPGMMSDAEKEKYGIEEIPISQLEKIADEHMIAPEIVKRILDSGETVLYYAHNMPMEIVPLGNYANGDSETPTPTLILPSETTTMPLTTPVATSGTAPSPTPTPLHTLEPAKEPTPTLVPSSTPTPMSPSRYNN